MAAESAEADFVPNPILVRRYLCSRSRAMDSFPDNADEYCNGMLEKISVVPFPFFFFFSFASGRVRVVILEGPSQCQHGTAQNGIP